jgi:NDP-sugar pyrophosphorylase family protein
MATGYLAELIEAFFRDGSEYGIAIDYFREHEPLGTVGALALIEGLAEDHVLVMNGDVLTDIDYGALLQRHSDGDSAATIATKLREVQISLGVLRFGEAQDPTRLTGYDEKPKIEYTASMGVYCFAPRALSHIEPGKRLDFPDLILRLIAAGETVRAWTSDDYWLDIGRHEDYEQAQEEFEAVRHRLIPPEP